MPINPGLKRPEYYTELKLHGIFFFFFFFFLIVDKFLYKLYFFINI